MFQLIFKAGYIQRIHLMRLQVIPSSWTSERKIHSYTTRSRAGAHLWPWPLTFEPARVISN